MIRNLIAQFGTSSFEFISPLPLSTCEYRIQHELHDDLWGKTFWKPSLRVTTTKIDQDTVQFCIKLMINLYIHHFKMIGYLKRQTDDTTLIQARIQLTPLGRFVNVILPSCIFGFVFILSLSKGSAIGIGFSMLLVVSFLSSYIVTIERYQEALVRSIERHLRRYARE